jgi:hypothetical protein
MGSQLLGTVPIITHLRTCDQCKEPYQKYVTHESSGWIRNIFSQLYYLTIRDEINDERGITTYEFCSKNCIINFINDPSNKHYFSEYKL